MVEAAQDAEAFNGSLKDLGETLKAYAQANGVTLFPHIMEKSIQPLVGQGMVPCSYGGAAACVAQGGDGSSHHLAGFAHPFPHISELGGRPESSQKFPYKSKVEEYLASGRPSVVEAVEMPRVEIILLPTDQQSVLGTDYVTDYAQLLLPEGRGNKQFQHGQPVRFPDAAIEGVFWGVNTAGQSFVFAGGSALPVNGNHIVAVDPVGPQYGPWIGLPPMAVLRAPNEIISVMEKGLKDSPYVPSSGYSLKHEDYVQGLLRHGWYTFVVGGAVRDALRGVVSKDVDIVTDAPFKNMESIIAHEVGGHMSNHFPYGALIQMGSDKQRALDVTCLRAGNVWFSESQIIAGSIRRDTIYRDFSCNALYYDPLNRLLIDPTTRGIKDSVNKTLFPSCPKGEEEEWLQNPRLGLRMFKMLFKGYTPSAEILRLLTASAIETQCKIEQGHRGASYMSKVGHWLLYRQLCGDLYYGTGTSYHDSSGSVKRQYKTRMTKLKTAILENGYESIWRKYVQPMLSKHIDV